MRGRPYRRGLADRPKIVLAAYAFGGAALSLLALGLILDALPEEGSLEWNGLPLGEYGTGDVWFGVVGLAACAAVCAAVSLTRDGTLPPRARRLMIGVLVAGAAVLAATLLGLAFIVALCSGGACD